MYQFHKCRPIKRDQKKQEVKEVKRVDKNAKDSLRGHHNRQNTVKGTPKRTRKDINKKANI